MTRTTSLKPIPTEYKRVRYDSKSEAIFALVMDLSPSDRIVGHPPGYAHPWDLLVELRWCPESRKFGEGPLDQVLVEYKPREPTNTYCDNLRRSAASDPMCADKICVVVFGSPWQPFHSSSTYAFRIIHCGADTGAAVDPHWRRATGWLGVRESAVRSAKTYRFDLLDGGRQTSSRTTTPRPSRSSASVPRYTTSRKKHRIDPLGL